MFKIDCRDMYGIGCGELTKKGSRRIISDSTSTDILSLWEEVLKKIGRDKGQEDDRFVCRKCFNRYVKVKKELVKVKQQVIHH